MKLLKVSTLGLFLGGMCVLNIYADETSSQGSSWSMKIEQLGDEDPKFESESVQYKDGQVVDKKSAKGIIDQNGDFVKTPESLKADLVSTKPANIRVFVPDESDYEEDEQENFDQNRFKPEYRSVCPIKAKRECPLAKFRKHHRSDFRHPWKNSEEFDEDFEEENRDFDSCFARLWKAFAHEIGRLAERDELFFRGEKAPCFDDPEMKERRRKFCCPKKWKQRRHKFMPHHQMPYEEAPQFVNEERQISCPNTTNFASERRSLPHFSPEEKSMRYNALQFVSERGKVDQEAFDETRFPPRKDGDFEFTNPSFRSW